MHRSGGLSRGVEETDLTHKRAFVFIHLQCAVFFDPRNFPECRGWVGFNSNEDASSCLRRLLSKAGTPGVEPLKKAAALRGRRRYNAAAPLRRARHRVRRPREGKRRSGRALLYSRCLTLHLRK